MSGELLNSRDTASQMSRCATRTGVLLQAIGAAKDTPLRVALEEMAWSLRTS
jgi:hypothetical protein